MESSVATDVGTDSLTMEENKIEAFNKLNNDTTSENSLEAFTKAPYAGAHDQAPTTDKAYYNTNENKVSQRTHNQCK